MLNQEQLDRLHKFARENGKNWKKKLCDLWYRGSDWREVDGHLLRQIRNRIGPKGLYKLDLKGDESR